jgi:hypothetical protein
LNSKLINRSIGLAVIRTCKKVASPVEYIRG